MDDIKYSIIIPCYNSSDTIKRALDSVTQQTYKGRFEVLVVDDCSKDNSQDVIKDYISKTKVCVRLICNEVNCGPGVSRNRAIMQARGSYFAFMDSDDYVDSSLLQKVDDKINGTNAEIIYFGIRQIFGKKVIETHCHPRSSKEDYMALATGSLCMFVSAAFLWNRIELPPISNSEDIAVIPILMSRAKHIDTLEDCLYNYIYYSTSTSSKRSPMVAQNFLTSWRYTLKHIDIIKNHVAIECHGIKTVLFGATLNALKADVDNETIRGYWDVFEKDFPNWYQNKYIASLPTKKRFFLYCVHKNNLWALKLYTKAHDFALKYL